MRSILIHSMNFTDEKISAMRKNNEVGCFCSVVANVLDCDVVMSEFELQLRYLVHFRTNSLGNGMNPYIILAIG